MVCLFYSKKQIAHYDYSPKGSYTDHYVSSSTKCFSHDVCKKFIVNVLWYSCSIVGNKLLIIFTNPTGNNLTANIFWQMLCTSSNKILINVLWYVYSIARNKLLIMTTTTKAVILTTLCPARQNFFQVMFVRKSLLMYYGILVP